MKIAYSHHISVFYYFYCVLSRPLFVVYFPNQVQTVANVFVVSAVAKRVSVVTHASVRLATSRASLTKALVTTTWDFDQLSH